MKKLYTNWRFKVNQDKSFHTTFTLKKAPRPNVNLYRIQILSSQKVKYLGLLLDRRLTWAPHMKSKRLQSLMHTRVRLHTKLTATQKYTHQPKHKIDNI